VCGEGLGMGGNSDKGQGHERKKSLGSSYGHVDNNRMAKLQGGSSIQKLEGPQEKLINKRKRVQPNVGITMLRGLKSFSNSTQS